jgi:hypothetical protein
MVRPHLKKTMVDTQHFELVHLENMTAKGKKNIEENICNFSISELLIFCH